jgi:hypothetical protein
MYLISVSVKSERNRRKQRGFEQKVAKEAKIWADNLGRPQVRTRVVISAPIRAGRFKRGAVATERKPTKLKSLLPLLPSVQILFDSFCEQPLR